MGRRFLMQTRLPFVDTAVRMKAIGKVVAPEKSPEFGQDGAGFFD